MINDFLCALFDTLTCTDELELLRYIWADNLKKKKKNLFSEFIFEKKMNKFLIFTLVGIRDAKQDYNYLRTPKINEFNNNDLLSQLYFQALNKTSGMLRSHSFPTLLFCSSPFIPSPSLPPTSTP